MVFTGPPVVLMLSRGQVAVDAVPAPKMQQQRKRSGTNILRHLQRTVDHTPEPQLLFYERNPFIFVFWDTWGMFQGSVGIFLESSKLLGFPDRRAAFTNGHAQGITGSTGFLTSRHIETSTSFFVGG